MLTLLAHPRSRAAIPLTCIIYLSSLQPHAAAHEAVHAAQHAAASGV